MIETPPEAKLLALIKVCLDPIDWLELAGAGTPEAPFVVRHYRHRRTRSDERKSGCLAIRWAGRTDDQRDDSYKNNQERPLTLDVDLEIELDLVEEDNEAAPDPTGWEALLRIAKVALGALRADDSPIAPYCDWVSDVDHTPDEDSKPDYGRLVQAISVVYRVRTDDTNVLLARGDNG